MQIQPTKTVSSWMTELAGQHLLASARQMYRGFEIGISGPARVEVVSARSIDPDLRDSDTIEAIVVPVRVSVRPSKSQAEANLFHALLSPSVEGTIYGVPNSEISVEFSAQELARKTTEHFTK